MNFLSFFTTDFQSPERPDLTIYERFWQIFLIQTSINFQPNFSYFLKILVNFNLLWLLFWLKLGCFLFQHLFTKQDGLNRAKD